MNLLKNLYLSDRFFYAMGAIVFTFFVSFVVYPFYYLAIVLLTSCGILLLLDIYLLFRQKLITVKREVAPVLSLNDDNNIRLILNNVSDKRFRLKVIDETPYQFNLRDFSLNTIISKAGKETIKYVLRPTIRGEYHFGNINLFLSSDRGFAMKRETTLAGKSVAVYPSVLQMKQQELKAMNHISFTQGDKQVRKLGRSY